MNDKAEKVYAQAFFELCAEIGDEYLKSTLPELSELNRIFDENPGFVKLMGTPTVPLNEKISMIKDIIKEGNVSEYTGNLLCVLAERSRINCFAGVVKSFRELYNERFKLAEITVTAANPLSDKLKEQITQKMSQIIGKTVTIREKVDETIIGGIIIDYGSRRYDGSVKARLNNLAKELGSVIA
ncbi:MAG: ATP synthase F1 subunit delta [Oscillospiraceae bacterium]|nr:ATP synthase F1 subunit delta [Oscillospiraceae bacterium]